MDEDKKHKKKSPKAQKEKEQETRLLEIEDQLKRAVADYRNLEKRFEEEKKEIIKYANKELILRLIPALDNLFLAGKYTTDEGVRLTIKTLLDSLKEIGVEKIITEDKEFDPMFMECVETVDGEENKVVEELRPGFTLYGKLVRPAQVKVGKG